MNAAGDESRTAVAPSAPGTLDGDRAALSSAQLTGARRPTTSASSATTSTARTTCRVHAVAGEPDRAADRDELHRHRSRPAPTTTGSPPRTRPATSGRPRTRPRRPSGTRRRPRRRARCRRSGRSGRRRLSWGGGDRQRRRAPLQRPPRHAARASRPRWRTGSRSRPGPATSTTTSAGHLLLQGHRRGRGRQHRRRLERGGRDGHARTRRAPSAPTGLAAPVDRQHRQSQLDRRRSDDVGVVRYNVHRGTQRRLHAQRRQPDRAADRHQLRRHRAGDRHLLLQGHRRGRGRQHQRRLERGDRHRRRRDPAHAPRHPRRHRRPAARSTSAWTRRDRQRRRHPLQPPPRHHAAASPPAPPTGSRNRPGSATADTGLAPGTYFYKLTAEDAAGNIGPVSQHRHRHRRRHHPAQHPHGLTATGGAGQASLTWTAATDNVAVIRYNLHRSTTTGFTPSTANRIAQPTGTSYTDTGLAAGTYYYKLTAEDAAGNISAASNQATATVTAPPVTGLVAAYGFDAGTGTTITDQSGTGNNGTLTNATWAGPAPASTATRSPSTAPTPPSPSPTPTSSTSPPA